MLPEKLKNLINLILSPKCAINIEKGGDSSNDYWIDFAKNNKLIIIHYISDDNIGITHNIDSIVYGQGPSKVVTTIDEAAKEINLLTE